MHIDWTISIGNLIWTGGCILVAIIGWRDLTWRIRNLEIWRGEHIVDSDSRGELINEMRIVMEHTKWQSDAMFKFYSRQGMHPSAPPGDD
jgi:hypothetical protein